MAPHRQGRNIAIVGANGHIGSHTLATLVSHDLHRITAIVRPDSTSNLPAAVIIKKGAFDDEPFLVEALKGQEVLIIQLPIAGSHYQEGFIRAAAKAGVKYVLPTEWGSDPEAKLIEELPVIAEKARFRQLVEELGVGCWIGVVNNPWYDFCLPMGDVLGVNFKERKATLWDGGNNKLNMSTLSRAGAATAELVAQPDSELSRYRNRCFYVSSFHVTEREILASVMHATSTHEGDWTIAEKPTDAAIEEANAMTGVDAHTSMLVKFFPLHYKSGWGGDYNHKAEDLVRFGYEKEDLDAVTADIISKHT